MRAGAGTTVWQGFSHDLQLMEREGSGFDLMYELLLASGRAAPTATEGTDSVHVLVPRRVLHPGVIRLIADANQRYQLTQRERIALATLAQSEGLSAVEFAKKLELDDPGALRTWTERLIELGLVKQSGRTTATRYFVAPDLLRSSGLDSRTTLKRIQPHRLRALILEDLERFPDSGTPDINRRVGPEIPQRTIRRALEGLIGEGQVSASGETRWRKYRLRLPLGQTE